jgi:hypothetical protein
VKANYSILTPFPSISVRKQLRKQKNCSFRQINVNLNISCWAPLPLIIIFFLATFLVNKPLIIIYLPPRHRYRPSKNSFAPHVFSDEELCQIQAPVLLLIGNHEVIYQPDQVIRRATRLVPHLKLRLFQMPIISLNTPHQIM